MKKAILAICLVVLLGALPVAAQVDMSVYVALGDSLTAGFASGSLHEYYQQRAYPSLLAQQTGVDMFALPLVSAPGIDAILHLESLSPTVILPSAPAPGAPINLQYPGPYNNLGVPGATLFDMLFTPGDVTNLLVGNTENIMFDIILRDGVNPAINQAIGLNPTFVTVWIGNNDILGAAVTGTPADLVTMTPVELFQPMYEQALGALAQLTTADVVVFTIPPVTAIPFVTTIPPYLDTPFGRFPLIGSYGPLPEDALVTLGASGLLAAGIGIPVELGGTGLPLPEDIDINTGAYGVVLRPEEITIINDRIAAFNNVITSTAAAFGYSVLDVHDIFTRIVQGELPMFGTIELSSDFLTGGIFSYDGVHPQNIGHGLIAMHLIDHINQTYGNSIPQVNMYAILQGETAKSAQQEEFVFTEEAFAQLQKIFPPRTDRQQRSERQPRTGARVIH
jgi:lysophospholipase L1-like esterase